MKETVLSLNREAGMKKSLIVMCLIALTASFMLTACAGKKYNAPELLEPAVVDIDTAAATVRELYNMSSYEGRVVPKISQLSFSSGGLIDEVYVTIGSSVKKGDILATLDTEMAQLMVDSLAAGIDYSLKSNELINKQAQSDIGIAEIELERLVSTGADKSTIELKKIEIENLKNSYEAAVAQQNIYIDKSRRQLEEYRSIISNSRIVADCDGTVLFCGATAGGWATAYSTVIWLADDDSYVISCQYIKSNDLDSAEEIYGVIGGERAEISYIPYDRATYISLLASNATMKSTFSIDKSDYTVENGMYAYVILIDNYIPDALTVPANAVVKDGAEYYVYLYSDDGTQSKQTVKTGIKTDAFIQITDGLKEGDVVYVGN